MRRRAYDETTTISRCRADNVSRWPKKHEEHRMAQSRHDRPASSMSLAPGVCDFGRLAAENDNARWLSRGGTGELLGFVCTRKQTNKRHPTATHVLQNFDLRDTLETVENKARVDRGKLPGTATCCLVSSPFLCTDVGILIIRGGFNVCLCSSSRTTTRSARIFCIFCPAYGAPRTPIRVCFAVSLCCRTSTERPPLSRQK